MSLDSKLYYSGRTMYSKIEYSKTILSLIKGKGLPFVKKNKLFVFEEDKIVSKKINNQVYDLLPWVSELKEIVLNGRERGLIEDVIIHGSYGDFTFTNFSDLEITLVLSRFLYLKKEKELSIWLKKVINPFILKVDPIQHHGPFFLWPDFLENYNELILPVCAYDKSWSIDGINLTVKKNIDLDFKVQKEALLKTLNALLNCDKYFFKYGMSPYSIKRLISNFLLLPAFFYQSHGEIIGKPESIERIMHCNDLNIRGAIDMASALRADWSMSPQWLSDLRCIIKPKMIPNGQLDMLITTIYRDSQMESKFRNEFLTLLPSACNGFLLKINNENY
jgi:hypothetical protein